MRPYTKGIRYVRDELERTKLKLEKERQLKVLFKQRWHAAAKLAKANYADAVEARYQLRNKP